MGKYIFTDKKLRTSRENLCIGSALLTYASLLRASATPENFQYVKHVYTHITINILILCQADNYINL